MNIIINKAPAPNRRLQNVSPECQQLITLMLDKDPNQRLDAAACLNHAWFKKYETIPQSLSVGVLQCLEAYSRESELKKAIFLLMAHQCALPALQELRSVYTYFDVRNLGSLSVEDLESVLRKSGFSKDRCQFILDALDRDSDGAVSWTEFLAAALCQRLANDTRLIDAAFFTFCAEGDEIHQVDFERVLAQGENVKRWQKALPSEMAAMSKRDKPKKTKNPFKALQNLVSGCVAYQAPPTVNKELFRAYVSQRLAVKTGNALFRVGS